ESRAQGLPDDASENFAERQPGHVLGAREICRKIADAKNGRQSAAPENQHGRRPRRSLRPLRLPPRNRAGLRFPAARIGNQQLTPAFMSDPSTPLMQQYHAIKSRYPHALLLFRLGDFYELFYEDAMLASRELQITLTSRNREKGQPIPMCGVPYHAADGYVARLIRAGFKIAICDQMEAPGPGKKLVRRQVVR